VIEEKKMFDLEKEIRNWLRTLRRSENLEDSDIAELESYLRDEIDHQMDRSMIKPNSTREAVRIGIPPASCPLLSGAM